MVSPFPIPQISQIDAKVVYLRKEKRKGENNSPFKNGVFVSGSYNDETVDFPIEKVEILKEESKSVSRAIEALFAFNYLNDIDRREDVSQSEKEMAIQTSISSGILCKFTAYIGMNVKTQIDNVIYNLRYKLEQNEERAKMELNKAIAFKKAGNKLDALNCLENKRKIDSYIENINKNISNLEFQQTTMNDPYFIHKANMALAHPNLTIYQFEHSDEFDDINYDKDNYDDELYQLYDDLDVSKAVNDVNNNDDEINELLAGFD